MKVSILNFANFTEPWGVFHSTNSKNIETGTNGKEISWENFQRIQKFLNFQNTNNSKNWRKIKFGTEIRNCISQNFGTPRRLSTFPEIQKSAVSFSVENFTCWSCWSHGKNLRISNFASCVYCAFRPTRMASPSESKWLLVRTWDIFRRKFTLPLLTWTFPQNHRSVVFRIASPGFPRIRWCQTQLNGQSPS